MLIGIEKVLLAEKLDWALVYGDTNSTLAGALATYTLHVPLAYVEAGLLLFKGYEVHGQAATRYNCIW